MASKGWRRAGWIAGGALALLLMLFLLRAPILRVAGRVLAVDDPLAHADAIVLMNGGLHSRPLAAAALHAQGIAPIVALARDEETLGTELGLMPNRTDIAIGILKQRGVPDSAIVRIGSDAGGVRSTRDEAVAFAAWARERGIARVVIVTNDYHTRRTRYAFRRALGDDDVELRMHAVPPEYFSLDEWWRTEHGLVTVVEEYLKFAFYVID